MDALPFSQYWGTTPKPRPKGYPEEPKTIGEHIRKKRMDVGLYQTDLAKLIHADAETIGNWEDGSRFPHIRFFPAIIAFLGYYSLTHETETFGGKAKRYRYQYGLSYRKAAKVLEVDADTVRQWEHNKRMPLRSMEFVLSVLKKTAQK